MTDTELYKRLAELTRSKELWVESIPYVASLLENRSPRITAKALWLLGEMGLRYPEEIVGTVGRIASFMDAQDDLLRERALNVLGRIGRARFDAVGPWREKMFGTLPKPTATEWSESIVRELSGRVAGDGGRPF